MLQNSNIGQIERVLIIIKLARQGLQLLETLTQAEQETCNDEGLSEILNKKIQATLQ